MNWADWFLLGLIGISTLVSLLRGFVKEAISLVGWVGALWAGLTFAAALAPPLEPWIRSSSLRHGVAFLAVFLAVLLMTGVLNLLVGRTVRKTGLGGTDRALGMVFGAARGVLLAAILVLLGGAAGFSRDPWWEESRLIGKLERVARQLQEALPRDLGELARWG